MCMSVFLQAPAITQMLFIQWVLRMYIFIFAKAYFR